LTDKPANQNGFTNKEMLMLLYSGQQELNERIDKLHEKVNSKMSRQELLGWITAFAVLSAALMAFYRS
jgi:streptomycin 6-kinase